MTTQTNLDLIWASTGGVTDPGDVKYQTGWISEIPTYQNFNFVLQNHAKNLLVLAEQGIFNWQTEIAYVAGTEVKEGTKKYFCIADNTGQQPSLDTNNNYWIPGTVIGDAVATAGSVALGALYKDASKQVAGLWSGNDITIESIQPLISMASNGAGKNWLVGNVSGEMVMIDVDTTGAPDGRNIALGQAGVYRVYHEGHTPTQSEVSGTIPDSPQDGKLYARQSGNWIEVTSTTVSTAPPPPIAGAGQGWYNLDDGQFYLDINDGDSSQWVPANPPVIPQVDAVDVDFDSSGVAGSETTVQGELELLDSMIGKGNLLINGDLSIWQRGTGPFTGNGGEYTADRIITADDGGAWVKSTARGAVGTSRSLVPHKYYLEHQVTSVGTGSWNLGQKVENAANLSEKTVTLSFWVWNNGSAFTNLFAIFPQNMGAAAGVTTSFDIAAIAGWVKYEATLTIPDWSGSVLASNSHAWVQYLRSSELAHVLITGVQLEFGNVATEYKHRLPAEELALCQRYYEKSLNLTDGWGAVGVPGSEVYQAHGTSTGTNTEAFKPCISFKVRKRVQPTTSVYGPNTGNANVIRDTATGGEVAVAVGLSSERRFTLKNTAATINTRAYDFHWSADAEL